jgi:membrane protein YdbS with pleckstrin-like domain
MNYLNQVLLNVITQGKTTIILVIIGVSLGLIALLFGRHQGSITKVAAVVASAIVAVMIVVILPDLLRGAASDTGSLTGITSRY